jgi:Mg-chelatase subunit ChlD
MDRNTSANLNQNPSIISNGATGINGMTSFNGVTPLGNVVVPIQPVLAPPSPIQPVLAPPSPIQPVLAPPSPIQPVAPAILATPAAPTISVTPAISAIPTALAIPITPAVPEIPPEPVVSPALVPIKHSAGGPFLIVISIAVLLIIGLGLFFLLRPRVASPSGLNSAQSSAGSKTQSAKKSAEETLLAAKIAIDTDADAIPDFVETAVGLNELVSDLDRCKVASCSKSDNAEITLKNTLIILDASGSMGLNTGANVKMVEAKAAIKNLIAAVPANENIGLMIYGHKGSNSFADKLVSCASADIIGELGSVNSASIDEYLNQVQPVGWEPIGLAIDKALPVFAGKEGQNNQIIIISGGSETCGSNPIASAVKAQASAMKIKINVIGFAVTKAQHLVLSSISKAGNGAFFAINSFSELEALSAAQHKNVHNFIVDTICATNASTVSYSCLKDTLDKTQAYLEPIIGQNISNGQIYDLNRILNETITKKYSDQIYEVLNSSTKQVNEQQSQLLDQ